MVSDLSNTSNKHLQGIYENLLKDVDEKSDGVLQSMYDKNISNQKAALKEIFKQISENNVSSGEKSHLEAGAAKLLQKIDGFEKKKEELEEKIAQKETAINSKVDELATIATGIQNKSKKMENEQHTYVKQCISDVFYMYQRGNIGKDAITNEIKVRIRNGNLSSKQKDIEKDIAKLDGQKTSVDALVQDAAGIIDEKNLLERQYGVVKSSYDLINKTLSQIGNTNTTYTNSDTDIKVPIYSIDKTNIVSDLFSNDDLNVLSTNSDYVEGSSETTRITQDEIKAKYKDYLNVAATGGDTYTTNNPAVKALGKAMADENFINDLKQSSMSNLEIAKFLASSFSGAMISCDDKGEVTVPYGHGDGAQKIYGNFVKFINKGLDDRYFKNTWNKDQGNTISSNAQIAALGNNYESIFSQLANGTPQFSFKEAMYALFDKNNGLFKNCGINYDLSEQNGEPTYTMDEVGDEETSNLYRNIAASIENHWGVKLSGANASLYTTPTNPGGGGGGGTTEPPRVQHRTDPLSFITTTTDGRKIENTFIIDRNGDGKFSQYENSKYGEFLGATGNWQQELIDTYNNLASNDSTLAPLEELMNEDGEYVFSAEVLDKMGIYIMSSEYTDNASVVESEDKFLRETTNNIDYRMAKASSESMGIESLVIPADTKVGDTTKKFDINGSEIFNDSFTVVTTGGQTYTASRKDDTTEFMDSVYGDAVGKNFEIGHTESEIDEVLDKNYSEFESYSNSLNKNHSKFFDGYETLKNFDQFRDNVKAMYRETNTRIENDTNVEVTKADNKARSYSNVSSWSSDYSEIRSYAITAGLNDPDSDTELKTQLKGIYTANASLDARGVVEKYKEQLNEENQINADKSTSSTAWEAVIKAFKSGISTTASEVKEIISSGQATTVDGIIEILKNKTAENSEDTTAE